MIHVGDIMSTVEGVQCCGSTQITKTFSPTVLKITPHGTRDIPHGTEHPPRYCTHVIQGASGIV